METKNIRGVVNKKAHIVHFLLRDTNFLIKRCLQEILGLDKIMIIKYNFFILVKQKEMH